jgi:hypothetical protein
MAEVNISITVVIIRNVCNLNCPVKKQRCQVEFKKQDSQVLMAYAYNPNFLGG